MHPIEDYAMRVGAVDVEMARLDLGRVYTEAEITAALKRLGFVRWTSGNTWESLHRSYPPDYSFSDARSLRSKRKIVLWRKP